MKRIIVPAVVAAALTFASAYAAEPWAKTVAFDQAAKVDTLTVPNGAEITWGAISFPAVPQKPGQVIVIRFQARGEWEVPAGWNCMTSFKLNDVAVESKTKKGAPRLINRSETATYLQDGKPDSMPAWSDNALLLAYGPADQFDSRITWQRDEGYWYVLDITDLVKSDGPNKLSASNRATLKVLDGKAMNVVFENISVGCVDEAVVKARLATFAKPSESSPAAQ